MKKYTSIANLLNTLERALLAAKRGLRLANKLKRNDLKSRIMGNMNRIRAEIRKFSKLPLFSGVAYDGIIKAIIK